MVANPSENSQYIDAYNGIERASSLGMGAVPTNAIDEKRLGDNLGVDFPSQALTYAVAFGFPDESRSRDHYNSTAISRLQVIVEER